jgi:hypothetical protein
MCHSNLKEKIIISKHRVPKKNKEKKKMKAYHNQITNPTNIKFCFEDKKFGKTKI